MSDLYGNLPSKMQQFSNQLIKDGKKNIKFLLSYGEKNVRKGKVQIEIEKLKWELKQRYNDLGQYVADKKILKSATDFSHDQQFLELVNEINRIKLYIEERQLKRDRKKNKLISE